MKRSIYGSLIMTIVAMFMGIALLSYIPSVKADGYSELSKYDVEDNFDSIPNASYSYGDYDVSLGKWSVFFNNENGEAEIMDDPTGNAMGKVMRLNNSPMADRSAGTYLHITYDAGNYYARNFTITYDFMCVGGTDTSWQGIYVRDTDFNINLNGKPVVLLTFQKGKGVSSDTIELSDGETRTGVKTDTCFEFSPNSSSGSGISQLREDNGIPRQFGRFFNVDGGTANNIWYTVKFEVKGEYFSAYIKIKNDSEFNYMGTAYLHDAQNKDYSGSIGIGVCGGNYYFDNVQIQNEDKMGVVAENLSPKNYGDAYCTQETAGSDSVLTLYSTANDGYVYGKWYKDAALTQEITPLSMRFEQYVYNIAYGAYEWKEVIDDNITLNTLSDLDAIYEGRTTVGEYYSGNGYRLKTLVAVEENGYAYYTQPTIRSYSVAVYAEDGGDIYCETLPEDDGIFSDKIELGSVIALKATPNSGNVFAGWYKIIHDEEDFRIRLSDGKEFSYTVELGGADIVAVFANSETPVYEITATLRATDAEGDYGEIVAGTGRFYEGETITLIAKAKEGFSFVCWEVNGEEYETAEAFNFTVSDDFSVTALFEKEKYRIYINDGIGGESVKIVTANSFVTLVAPLAPYGYNFSGWQIDGIDEYNQDQTTRTVTFTADVKNIFVKAMYIGKSSKVTLSCDDMSHGSVLGSGQYQYGATVYVRPMAKSGYSVSGYTVRGTEVNVADDGTLYFVMPANDVIVRVEFTAIDSIDTKKEITTYVVFAVFIVGLTAAITFTRKKKKED